MVYFRLLFQDSFGETEEKRDENLVKDNLWHNRFSNKCKSTVNAQ
jgi:hypothetical protein